MARPATIHYENEREAQQDLLRQYLNEIGRYPLLSDVEEVELARAIEDGRHANEVLHDGHVTRPEQQRELEAKVRSGRGAKRRFIQCNLRLVVSVAKRYSWSNMPLLDLIQEGNLGLIRAVEKFDHRRGFKFSTYATWWIRQGITRALAYKGRTIRIPVHMVETLYRIRKVEDELFEELGRAPNVEEIATRTELSPQKVEDALRARPEPISLHQPVGEEEGVEFGDFIEDSESETPFEAVASALRQEGVARALEVLTERERGVLILRFGLATGRPLTLREVGSELGLSQERIRRIEGRALSKLRHPSAKSRLGVARRLRVVAIF